MSSSSSTDGSYYALTEATMGYIGMSHCIQLAEKEGACRLNIKISPDHLHRFTRDEMEHSVIVTSGSYDPAKMIEWIDQQTTGKWSVRCMFDTGCRPGKSLLIFSFEKIESAVLLKMFQENIASEAAH